MAMRRPAASIPPDGSAHQVSDEDFRKRFPTIMEYLTEVTWEDGTARESSTVTTFIEDGLFKCALNDRDGHRSLYVTGDTFKKAMEALEKAVSGTAADWRAWQAKGKRGRG